MADEDEIDQKTATIARTKLHAFLDTNPPPDKAKEAHRLLAMLPEPQSHVPPQHSDAELGLENPLAESTPQWLSGGQTQAQKDAVAVDNAPGGIHDPSPGNKNYQRPTGEMEDGIASEMLGQAVTMVGLYGLGWLLSKPAQAVLNSRGGQAARFLKSRGLPFEEPFKPFEGEMKPTELDSPEVNAEINRIRSEAGAVSPDPEVARARELLRGKEPHIGLHGIRVPGAALPAIMGRLTVPAKIAAATGAGIAHPVSSIMMNPLMQAVMGVGYDGAPLPANPELGGNK